MRKLTLNNKTASIEINGEVYDVLLSDSDITELAEVVKEKCKNLTYTEATVKILSAVNDDSRAQIQALADELCESYK